VLLVEVLDIVVLTQVPLLDMAEELVLVDKLVEVELEPLFIDHIQV
jgi:hypothetical protein